MKKFLDKAKGFTLFEMLMVLVIMGTILMLLANYSSGRLDQFKRDKGALQMQEILNAGMAFYTAKGYWPSQSSGTAACTTGVNLAALQPNYLPSNLISPWGVPYTIGCNSTTGTFSVSVTIPGTIAAKATASVLAGMIPLGSVDSTGLVVTGQVNIPGQNLNNARSVNFASLYHNGGCVPAPTCPPGMSPEIMVVPTALFGDNDGNTTFYSLYGFAATALGAAGSPPGTVPVAANAVADCFTTTTATACQDTSTVTSGSGSSTAPSGTLYWRVCLTVVTEKGIVAQTDGTTWAQLTSLLAITRCAPNNEYSGSDFSVWTR